MAGTAGTKNQYLAVGRLQSLLDEIPTGHLIMVSPLGKLAIYSMKRRSLDGEVVPSQIEGIIDPLTETLEWFDDGS